MARMRIVALGSSFAAGPGIEPIENKAAGRSLNNYAHQLAKKLNADLIDVSVSGATLLNILNEKQGTVWESFEPQVNSIPPDADIVTLTAGGNDIGYIQGLMYDSFMAYLGPAKYLFSSEPAPPKLNLDQLTDRFLTVLDKIHAISPKAKVYLVEYLTIIGSETQPGKDTPLNAEQIQHHDGIAKLLAQAYVNAAQARSWVVHVPVADESTNHALGSEVSWMNGFTIPMLWSGAAPYHPNLAGHTAIARMLYQRVSSGDQ